MELKSIFKKEPPPTTRPNPVSIRPRPGRSAKDDLFYKIKNAIHTKLVEEANLKALDELDASEIRAEVSAVVDRLPGRHQGAAQRSRAARPDLRDHR